MTAAPPETTSLTDLAEHIAANYGLQTSPEGRLEAERQGHDFHPLAAADILAAHRELAELAERVTEPVAAAPALLMLRDDGEELFVAVNRATPEDVANALMCLAAEAVALHREVQRTTAQFIAVSQLAQRQANGEP